VAQFNPNDPRYQRELQKTAAKRSMGPQRGTLRSAVGQVAGRHAGYQLGRQLQFGRLAQQKQASDISHELNLARLRQTDRSLGMREKQLASEQSGLNFTLLSGLGQLGLGYYQGREKEKKLRKSTALARRRHQEILDATRQATPRSGTSEGALMGLRARRLF